MTRESWFAQVRRAEPGVTEVANALGLHVRRSRFGPCPACGHEDPRHPPVTARAEHKGWMCAHCKATGDAVQLAAWVMHGRPKPTDWSAVRGFFAGRGWCEGEGRPWVPPPRRPPPPEPGYPDATELGRLLAACRPVEAADEASVFCRARGWSLPVPAAVLPEVYPWPRWWGFGRERVWRLAVTAVDARGHIRSLHARAIVETAGGKTRWPVGCGCRRLLFADPVVGRPMLRGAAAPSCVLVVEGITDYLAACAQHLPDVAILGATSGGFAALGDARLGDAEVVIATDADTAGDAYATEIRRWVPGARRVGIEAGTDLDDFLRGGGDLRRLMEGAT